MVFLPDRHACRIAQYCNGDSQLVHSLEAFPRRPRQILRRRSPADLCIQLVLWVEVFRWENMMMNVDFRAFDLDGSCGEFVRREHGDSGREGVIKADADRLP